MEGLAFFAHPDDETMLCGGTLALLASCGIPIHLVCATRGEGGDLGVPPIATRAEAGRVRSQELACASQSLGCSSLTFLDYVDPLVGEGDTLFPFSTDEEGVTRKLLQEIETHHVGVLITHGSNGEYGHPAHQLIYRSACRAVKRMERPITWYTVQAMFPEHPRPDLANQDDPADLIIDCSSVLEQKKQAALCHRTQHDLFTRHAAQRAGHFVRVEDTIERIESLHRVVCHPDAGDPLADTFQTISCLLPNEH